ncbi:carbohydrate ABC transporter permease [Geminicoccus roseus]|uniref:carbohydrate ABC transporter permease n=1 Tax=Geminicoccus roseus TaxID=404900 RepID=UPI0004023487|nr:sugar ABC transporter permease [Geminicoccus roseus]
MALALPAPLRVNAASARPGRRWMVAWLLLAPSLVLLALFTYGPILRVLHESLYGSPLPGQAAPFLGLDNYARLLGDPAFRNAAWNTALYAFWTILPGMGLGLVLALALEATSRVSSVLRAVFFFPTLVPLVAAASIFVFLFLPGIGLLDRYLALIGIRGPNWLGDPDVALYAIIGLTVWKNAGYYMLFFLAGLQQVQQDLYDAATIDGAGVLARLRHVTLPALRPTMAFVFVIALVNVLVAVDHVFVLTKGGPSGTTDLILFFIYRQAHENHDLGFAAAATVVSVAVLLLISGLGIETLERGLRKEEGA